MLRKAIFVLYMYFDRVRIIGLFVAMFAVVSGFSQEQDSVAVVTGVPVASGKEDSLANSRQQVGAVQADTVHATFSVSITPQKTALYSAVIPGLGQIYNRHYWKLPIIYAGVGVAVYFIYDNSTNYNKYRRMYSGYLSNDAAALADMEQSNLSPEYVKYLQDYHRRYLDITVLVTALGYTLQVLDAAIFAHLKGFDMSEDISLKVQPVAYPNNGIGLGIVMRF